MKQFDVALWQHWPSRFPEYVGYVWALNAFDAVSLLMIQFGLRVVGYASARALDGSLHYRGFGVCLGGEASKKARDEYAARRWVCMCCERPLDGDTERFQCAGCGRRFCKPCTLGLPSSSDRVCDTCFDVWSRIADVQAASQITGLVEVGA